MPRVRSKGIRSQWSSAQLKLAINAIKNGSSKKAASQKYGISRRTLTRYLEKNISKKDGKKDGSR